MNFEIISIGVLFVGILIMGGSILLVRKLIYMLKKQKAIKSVQQWSDYAVFFDIFLIGLYWDDYNANFEYVIFDHSFYQPDFSYGGNFCFFYSTVYL